MSRSTLDVLQDHPERRRRNDLEGDLAANYDETLTVLAKDGVFHGRDGVRQTAAILAANLPGATFSDDLLRVDGEYGLLSWSARADDGARTCHGADSFVVRDGRIVCQTIHYEVNR